MSNMNRVADAVLADVTAALKQAAKLLRAASDYMNEHGNQNGRWQYADGETQVRDALATLQSAQKASA